MRSPSIERLYAQLNKHILLAQAYTEISELNFIIKTCRLKPYNIILNKNKELVLHRYWVDEFGNSLRIIKNKRIKITYNDLTLDKSQIVCTDLYYGLSIDKIAKMSKLMFFCSIKEEETYRTQSVVAFLGIDNFLRAYVNLDGEWLQVSPLCLGMKVLKNIARNMDLRYFLELIGKENAPLPCALSRAWLSFMPPSGEFLQLMTQEHDQVLSFLNFNKGII